MDFNLARSPLFAVPQMQSEVAPGLRKLITKNDMNDIRNNKSFLTTGNWLVFLVPLMVKFVLFLFVIH